MSLWHCPEHGLVGPMGCCPKASLASFGPDHGKSQAVEVGSQGMDRPAQAVCSSVSPGPSTWVDLTALQAENRNQSDGSASQVKPGVTDAPTK